jgi:Asp-tRNA(Asn)/Glu-tRNA(Gln) amidotransferase C subunit
MANDFTWRKVSEKEREQISRQAKEIMDKFASKLGKLDLGKETFIERKDSFRNENDLAEIDKKIMFENAKEKNSDFIIAEKKKW